MTPSRVVRVLIAFLFLIFISSAATAATTEFRVLFDVDSDPDTGCDVNGMDGVDLVLVTQVTEGDPMRVTRTHRQHCMGSVLGSPMDINTEGWGAGWNPTKKLLTFETRIPFMAFGSPDMPSGIQAGFDATRTPSEQLALVNADNTPIIIPPPPVRRRGIGVGPDRHITMDGNLADWGAISPIIIGLASNGTDNLRLLRIMAWPDPNDNHLYFAVTAYLGSDHPYADDNIYPRLPDESLSVPAPGVLDNDGIPGNAPLTAEKVSDPSRGTVTLNPDGSFTYSPTHPQLLTSDEFEYKAKGAGKESNIARVIIQVDQNEAPLCSGLPHPNAPCPDFYTTPEDTPKVVPAPGVLENDKHGDKLEVTSNTQPSHGTVVFNANGDGGFTYTPDDDFFGTDTFTYTATKKQGAPPGIGGTATVTITVTNVNDEPSFTPGPSPVTTTASSGPYSQGWATNISAGPGESGQSVNFVVSNNNTALFSVQPKISPTGTLTFTPAGSQGTATVSVRLEDNGGTANGGDDTSPSVFFTIIISCGSITVTNPATNTATVGVAFSQNFTQTGAVGGATFTTSSTLPAGLTLATNGTLSGTPTEDGTFPIVVTVTDGTGCMASGPTYNLVVNCQTITVTNPANANGTAASPFSETFTQAGGNGATTFSLASGTLPAGLTLAANGVLSGTPTQTGSFPITVMATDVNGCTGTGATYNLVIGCQTITVTNPANGNGTAASPFSETFTQTGGIGATTFSLASGTLPAGLTLAANGVLSGTPTQTGSFPVTVTATDSNGCTGTGATYTIIIGCQTITVTNPANANGTVSAPFSETFTQTGAIGTATFTTASTLPAGLTLAANGTLSGTPTQDGTFPIVVTVTDSNGCTGTGATYNLVIGCQTITVTNPVNTGGTVSAGFSETFTQTAAVGGATFTLNSGVLPTGLTLATNGTLSGTPMEDGSFPITVLVTDGNGCTGVSATYNLVIACQTITVTNPANATGPAGTPFSETFTQTGAVGGATFTTASTLPTGLSLSTAGVLSGTPTQGGTFPIVVTVTDGNGCTGTSATYNLIITCPTINVTNPANANGTASSPFSETFTQTGAIGTATFTTSSTLPAGLSLSTAGVLSGTPTQTGVFPIVVTVTDSNGCTGTGATYNLTIACQTITVNNPANGNGTAGSPFSETFTHTAGIGTTTFSLATGTLPAGLTLAPNGVLSGTPTQTGNFPITVTATDSNGCQGTGTTYTIIIGCQTITVTNPANTNGTVSAPFSETFTQTSAIGTATFTTASTLPAGLSLSTAGVLSGTPTEDGTFPIVVTVTDSNGCTGTGTTYTLIIGCQTITVTNPVNTGGTVNAGFSETFTQTAAVGGATFTLNSGVLPTGLTLATNGTLSGTPMEDGSFPITVLVTDGNGCTGVSATYNLVIACQTITVTNPANATGPAGTPFSETFTQTGAVGGATFTTASTLPTGLSLSTAGVLSGTPTQGGTFPIVVTVTDGNGCTGTGPTYNLIITCPVINVTNPGNTAGTAGSAFSETFTQTGGQGTVTFTTSSTLPNGLTLSTAGVLSGTPTQVGNFPIVVTVTDQNGCIGTGATYNLVIACQTITVNNPANANGTAGTPFSETFTAPAAIGGATFTLATGTLPNGLTLAANGTLSGTPTQVGSFPITVLVTDGNGCTGTSATYNLLIACQVITVNNPANASGTVNAAFSETFTQTGAIGSASFTTASTLPNGLTLSTAGVLSGTPTEDGSFPIVVTVTDANGCTGTSATYNLVIACQTITVTNPANANGTVGVLFSETFTQTGAFGTATFTTASTLPLGVTLSTAGVLSGTPTEDGSFPIVVTVTDSNGCTGTSATYNLVIVCQTITVTNPGVTTGTVDAVFSQTFTQTGAIGTATFTTSSTLPSGLTLSTAGVLSGTPGQPGTFPIVVTVTDSNGCTGTSPTYNLVIACQTITVTNPGVTTGTVDAPFSQTFTQNGVGTHTPATFTTSSTLPSGLSLSTAGVLSGTPGQPGTFPIVVTVTDVNGCTGTGATYNLVIACQTINVINPGVTTATYNVAFSQTFTQTGVGTHTPASFTTSSTLPNGLTLATNGTLSGTPTQTGTFPIVVTVTDVNGCTGTGSTYTLAVAPVANNDTFNNGVNNTQYVLTGGTTVTPSTPSVQVAGSILANDQPAGFVSATSGTFGTTAGGSVTIAADGTFLYTPPALPAAAALASDTFQYTVTSNTGGTGPVTSAPATVTINLANRVWYVKNDSAAGGDGRSHQPFDTLAEAETASTANDYIFVYFGNGTTSGQNAGITLKTGQKLYGQGVALIVNGNTLVVAGSQPLITHSGGNATVQGNNLSNVEVKGLNIASTANDALNPRTTGGNSGSWEIAFNTISAAALQGINVDAGGSGTFTLSAHDNTLTTTGNSIDVNRTAGTLIITAFDDNVVTGNTGGAGIVVVGTGAAVIFDAVPTGNFDVVSGGNTAIGISGNTVGGAGMVLTNISGDLSFTDLDIFATGVGLSVTGNGVIAAAAGTRVTVAASVGVIESSGAAAVDIDNATIDLQLSSITATNSATRGVSLVRTADGTTNARFSAAGGSITMAAGSPGPGFNVSGVTGANNAGVSYAGTITNNGTGRAVHVDTWSGDDAATDNMVFSGAIDENGAGILLNANSGSRSITFSGGLDIDTTTGEGFGATSNTNALGLHITGTNNITSTSATALRVTNTTIGTSHLTFVNVSSGNNTAAADPVNGIVIDTTGASGSLRVQGTAAANSGGVIQFTTGAGIVLTSTLHPQLAWMNIHDIGRSGVDGFGVTNFTFNNSTVNNVGTAAAGQYEESNIAFNDAGLFTTNALSGTVSITNNTLTNARRHGIDIQNGTGTVSNVTIQNNIITSSTSAASSLGHGILVATQGSAATTAHLTTGTISGNTITFFPNGSGIQIAGGSGNAGNATSATLGANGTPISITGNFIGGSAGTKMGQNAIIVSFNGQNGVSNFDISNNGSVGSPLSHFQGIGISVFMGGSVSGATTVNGNRIASQQTIAAGSAGIAVQADDGPAGAGTSAANVAFTINNNNVSQNEGFCIRAIARASLATADITIQNNTVTAPTLTNRNGIRVDSGSAVGDTTVCLLMTGNTSAGSGVNAGMGIRKQGNVAGTNEFGIVGLAPSPTTGANAAAKVTADNPAGGGTDAISGDNYVNCSI
jgi:hypothetical protein